MAVLDSSRQFSTVLGSYVSADLICCNRLSLYNTAYDPFLPLTPHVINRSYTPDVSIFKDLNLRVSAGSNLALVGPSCSGKSSVIALLMRFYDPTSGSILIDGCVIRCLNLRSLRLKIGLVQQEPALFSTTVYENIQYGKDGASEIEVIRAAKAANVHGFISRMQEGYHTQVGKRGVQLSGGQKQRVAIAWAILKDPAILLLDEATSALDSASEKTVQEALDKRMKGRTTMIVAHRCRGFRSPEWHHHSPTRHPTTAPCVASVYPILTVACSPTIETLVATGGEDDMGFLWSIGQGDQPQELLGHSNSITSLAFSADGKLLASESFDGLVQVWDAYSGSRKCTLAGPSDGVEVKSQIILDV